MALNGWVGWSQSQTKQSQHIGGCRYKLIFDVVLSADTIIISQCLSIEKELNIKTIFTGAG